MAEQFPKRYTEIKKIGEGASSIVYSAYDVKLDRAVAVKKIKDSCLSEKNFHKRFEREVKAMAKLRIPGVPVIYDFSSSTRNIYYTMELVEGVTLREFLENVPASADLKTIMIKILKIIKNIHEIGIIHRDLKPSNIMISRTGDVYITDFGISRFLSSEMTEITQTGKVLGTPYYISPEQIRGDEITARADIYSLGVIFFEMLTGNPPYTGELHTLYNAHLSQDTPEIKIKNPTSINETLKIAVKKMLQKKPESRFQSAEEILDFLESSKSVNFFTADTLLDTVMDGKSAEINGNNRKDTERSSAQEPIRTAPVENLNRISEGIKISFPFLLSLISIFNIAISFIVILFQIQGRNRLTYTDSVYSCLNIIFYSNLLFRSKFVYKYIIIFMIVLLTHHFYRVTLDQFSPPDFILELIFFFYLKFSKEVKKHIISVVN